MIRPITPLQDKESDINLLKVANILDEKFRNDLSVQGYAGFDIDKKHDLIKFFAKTEEIETIYFDPYTLECHLQNNLWLDEFNSAIIMAMASELIQVRIEWEKKVLGLMKE